MEFFEFSGILPSDMMYMILSSLQINMIRRKIRTGKNAIASIDMAMNNLCCPSEEKPLAELVGSEHPSMLV